MTRFLTDLFDAGNPWNGKTDDVSMHDLLVEGAQRIEGSLEDAPLARAEVLSSIGSALMHQGDDALAYKLLREAADLRRKELGPDSPLLASTLVQLGVLRQRYDLGEGERYLREAVRIREENFGTNDLNVANSLADLADIVRRQRHYPEAEKLLLRSLAIREKVLKPDDPRIAASLSGLGHVYADSRQFAKAEPALLRALAIRTKAFGPDHYVTSRSYDTLGDLYQTEGNWPESEKYTRKALAIVERVRGPDHKYTAWVRADLAGVLIHQKKYTEAKALLVRALPPLQHAQDLQDVYAQARESLRQIEIEGEK